MLIKHCNDIYEVMYRRFPDLTNTLPLSTEYRCYMFTFHLTLWECFALCNPEDIRIDPFDVFVCMKGGGLFQNFMLPNGHVFSNLSSLRNHGLEDRGKEKRTNTPRDRNLDIIR